MQQYTHDEWIAEARRRFGSNRKKWKFVCPRCGHVQSVQQLLDANHPERLIAFACIGRSLAETPRINRGEGPCLYEDGSLNPVTVKYPRITKRMFDFA